MQYDEEYTKAHYDMLGASYEAIWGSEFHSGLFPDSDTSLKEAYYNMNRRLAKIAELPCESKILSLGCGRGAADRFLADRYSAEVFGLDLSPEQIKVAKNRAEKSGLASMLHYVEGSMTEIPFEDSSFDAIWMQQSLVHCHDKDKATEEFYRVLKPKGRMIIESTILKDDSAKQEVLKTYGKRVHISDIQTFKEQVKMFYHNGLWLYDNEDISDHLKTTYEKLIERSDDKGLPLIKSLIDEKKLGAMLSVYEKDPFN